MLGYADDEIEPTVESWERLLHPDDKARARELNESVVRGVGTYDGEFRLRHKDGHYIHVLSRGFAVRHEPGGPVVRIVGTHFDLTERKLADAERARTELLSRLVFAQEDERRRIAREMHDQFGEQLTALNLRIRLLKEACGDHAGLSEQVGALEDVAQRLDRDVDHLVWELRPTALDDLGLRAALANYINDWSQRVHVSAQPHDGLLTIGCRRRQKRRSIASRRKPSPTWQALAGEERRGHPRAPSRSRHVDRRRRRRASIRARPPAQRARDSGCSACRSAPP